MPKVDTSALSKSLQDARVKIEEVTQNLAPIMGDEDDKTATIQSLSDADEALGGAILMLKDFILECNAIAADQEARLQALEAKMGAPVEVAPPVPAPAEVPANG